MKISFPTLDKVDEAVGEMLERAVRSHHRRRLTKLGFPGVLNPQSADLWVPGERPPRAGNAVEVLVDGDDALAALADALAQARSHAHIAGWHLTPNFRLTRDLGAPTLVELLNGLGERVGVRVILWAGPPMPAFQPTRGAMKKVQSELTQLGRVQCVLDARERTLHCHHEKIVVIDDEVAFVGGIDLSDLSGDRWDRRTHPPRGAIGWHDAATRLRGPIVADVAEHFRQRWNEVAHQHVPPPVIQPPAGAVTLQLVRTVPERTYDFAPRGEFSIAEAYVRALRSAERLIYLENQFLWSTEIAQVLMDKLRNPPHPDFRMVLVLPARPSSGADTTRGQLGCLVDADDGAGHLLAATLVTDGPYAPYVHAKVGVIDDRWLTIGSANLNEHSLFNDTEVNIVTQDADLARQTRLALWSEHLDRPEADLAGDPTTVIDTIWKVQADQPDSSSAQPAAARAKITRLPAVSRRAERLIGPVRGLLVDG